MNQPTRIFFLAVFGAAILLLPGRAAAQIPVLDDAFTQSAYPTTNFNTTTLNVVQGSNTYLRFDLSALPVGITASNVQKAVVRLYLGNVNAAGSFDVYLAHGAWSESTLTYANAPALGILVSSGWQVQATKNHFIDVDVTAAVQAWLTGTANDGIALVCSHKQRDLGFV